MPVTAVEVPQLKLTPALPTHNHKNNEHDNNNNNLNYYNTHNSGRSKSLSRAKRSLRRVSDEFSSSAERLPGSSAQTERRWEREEGKRKKPKDRRKEQQDITRRTKKEEGEREKEKGREEHEKEGEEDDGAGLTRSASAEVVVRRNCTLTSKILKKFGTKQERKIENEREKEEERGGKDENEEEEGGKKRKENENKKKSKNKKKNRWRRKKGEVQERYGMVACVPSDHYRVGASLGKGGTGEVFYGLDKRTNTEVVRKPPFF